MSRIFSFAGVGGVLVGLIAMALTLFSGRVTDVAFWHFAVSGGLMAIYGLSRSRSMLNVLKSRQARLGAFVSIYTILVFAAIVVLNVIGAITNYQVADLTQKGLYTLSGQTKQVLGSLRKDLYINAFFSRGRVALSEIRDVDRLLRTFDATSSKVHLRVIDPEVDLVSAENFGVYQNGILVLEYNNQTRKVNTITEENLTNTIIRLLDDRPRKICFTVGHGESAVEGGSSTRLDGLGQFAKVLEEINYGVGSLDLAMSVEVPPECTVVVMVGPDTPVATSELIIMDNYLRLGGRVMVSQNAGLDSGLNSLLARWGVKLNDDVVLDKLVEGTFLREGFAPTRMSASVSLVVNDYNRAHPIAQDLSVKNTVNLFKARSISMLPSRDDIVKRVLVKSKKDSWGESRVKETLTGGKTTILNPRDGDVPGPLVLAVAISLITESTTESLQGYSRQARLVVVGNSSWLQNILMDETRNYNTDLAINMIGWLAGLEEFLSIGSKADRAKSLYLRYNQKEGLFNLTVVFLPELFLLIGLLVWWVRR